MRRQLLAGAALIASVGLGLRAQLLTVPVDQERGHVALGLVLRHLANTGVLMMATAHPDDENNGLLVELNRGQGFRTALATATRGNGGQNEIGPELFEALGVLRTEELAAMHRFDGAEQYFTRAVDFGFSFSVDETFQKWGREDIIADYVRLIRTIRPDVMLGMSPLGNGGGQHHQASALLSREAFKAAGNPARYPDQIRDGLRPWQAKKYYFNTFISGFGAAEPAQTGKVCRLNLAVYDPLLGRTYSEIGTEARSMHKCQGMAQLLALPGPSTTTYQLVESTIPEQFERTENSLFDGVDTTIPGLARLAGGAGARRSRRTASLQLRRRFSARRRPLTVTHTTPSCRRCSSASTTRVRCAVGFATCRSSRLRGPTSTDASSKRKPNSSRRCCLPMAFASMCSPTMVSWCPGRRSS